MSEIRIVEYNDSYAASVATMWNNSTGGWNGADFSTTTEKVLAKESISARINLFLAVDMAVKDKEPKVVGYCRLTKDSKDEDALYIALLSVIPEYMNKKVGKALVLESVKRTIELNYPKLYLHTWSGNTKAVPLYKKTGFFWEHGEEIHLINHIPSVINCEAIKDYFIDADWYDDSTRIIDIVPDGRKDNKFEYYTYSWEKNGKKLNLEYSKLGKGLRKIDCDDYTITATVCNRDLSFGKKHKISYEIINKSGSPLNIEMNGVDDKGIEFEFDFNDSVKNTVTTEAEFFVKPIKSSQDSRGTHPKVCTNIKINGKLAEFKSGIVPKFPLYFDLRKEAEFCYVGQEGEIFLDVESFLDVKATFEFDLSHGTEIVFEEPNISIELEAHEKRSIPVKYRVNKGYLYNKRIQITAILKNGDKINFSEMIANRTQTFITNGFQETDNQWEMSLSKYRVNVLKKRRGCGTLFVDSDVSNQNVYFLTPKLGKPFTVEFDKREADKVEIIKETDSKVMKVYYSSLEIKDVDFVINYRMFSHGILERWLEITNNKDEVLDDNFIYCDRFAINRENIYIPYENNVIRVQRGVDDDFTNYSSKKITENWIYSGNSKMSSGVTWPKEYDLKILDWFFTIDHSLNGLKSGKTLTTKPVTFFMNTFDMENFRKFVYKTRKPESINISLSSELIVNDRNPFINEKVTVELKDYKSKPMNAELKINSANNTFKPHTLKAIENDKVFSITTDLDISSKESIELINCDIRFKMQQIKQSKAVFPIKKESIELKDVVEEGRKVLSVNNGSICFKTSPEFAPCIFSLKQNDQEWVDSSFPKTCSKAWWTPWYGGLFMSIEGVSEKEILEENTTAEFLKLEDNFNNTWEGVKIITKIEKKDEMKGISYEQFYLTLPGSPVVVNFNKINNNSNKYLNNSYYKLLFYKTENDIKNSYWKYSNQDNEIANYYNGLDCTNIMVDYNKVHSLNSDESENKILYFFPKKVDYVAVCTNESTIPRVVAEGFDLKNNDSYVSNYEFMIFTDKDFTYKQLEDLKYIKFDV